MQDEECLVFVEVRFRGHSAFGHAADSVDTGKRHRLTSAAATFLAGRPQWQHSPVRFDVVAMDKTVDGTLRFNWIRDAFRPE